MKEIFNILKKYIFLIILMIGLIILQAMCDLKLPDYTSDIVNVGIQQNGIKSTDIKVIRKSEMDKVKLFMSTEAKKVFDKNYTLVSKKDKEYLKKYEIVNKEDIYVRNKNYNSEEVIEALTLPLAIKASLEN